MIIIPLIMASAIIDKSVTINNINNNLIIDGGMIVLFDDEISKVNYDYKRCYNATSSLKTENIINMKLNKEQKFNILIKRIPGFFKQSNDPELYTNFHFKGRPLTQICERSELVYIVSVK